MGSELLLTGGEALPTSIRVGLIIAAVATSALVFYKDFKDFEVPDWTVDVCGIPIIAFWVYFLCPSLDLFNVLGVVWFFLIFYSFTRVGLTVVGWVSNIGGGDATYASVLILLLPSPVLWGSPFAYVESRFSTTPLDFVLNVALLFVVTALVLKVYALVRRESIAFPFTPAVAATFGATVLFGALWRPVVMPLVELAVGVLGGFL